MNRTQFYFFLPLVFGIIGVILGGLLTAGHRLRESAADRRRSFGGFLVKGFRRDTSRHLLISGVLLTVVGVIGVVASA